jgi:transposase InsO family protein
VNYERLMSDTCDMGKYLPGLSGFKYFQLIQDEGSRYKWCFPLEEKSDANANTIKLMTELLAQGHRVKTFSSDGGGEFVNRELEVFCEARGIRFVPTHPYTPEENALVEKLNGVLVGKMRAAMHAADLPNRLWPEVLQYIVDVDNMSATRALNGRTPSEKLLGKAPDVSKIRVCGSVGFIHEPKRKTKLSPKAEPGLLLGFAQRSPGYRLLHLRTGKLVEARDVRFREDITVSRQYTSSLLNGQQASYKQIPFVPLPVEYVATESNRKEAARTVTDNLPEDAETAAASSTSFGGGISSSSSSSGESETEDEEMLQAGEDAPAGGANPGSRQADGTNAQPAAQPQQRGGQRAARHQTRRQRQAATGVQANTGPARRSGRRRRQNVRLGGYVLSVEVELVGTPASVDEAMRSPQCEQWKEAMKAEWESLLKNGTWKLVDRPKSSRGKRVKVLTTKWVYSVKRDEKGNILRYKARLVIHGFKQRFGFEYWDTYSPVVRIITMLLVLLIALLLGLDARHVDVETAFLNSPLRGVVIYMEQPAYFDDGTGRVCWLLKGIYGLKQAARIWYQTLHAYLVEIGFKRCGSLREVHRWQNCASDGIRRRHGDRGQDERHRRGDRGATTEVYHEGPGPCAALVVHGDPLRSRCDVVPLSIGLHRPPLG